MIPYWRLRSVPVFILIAGCINDQPLSPQCGTAIDIELPNDVIVVGDVFIATASNRVEQCLVDLRWTATGSIRLQSSESFSATFMAEASGAGQIRVQNRFGNLGIADIDVDEAEGSRTR